MSNVSGIAPVYLPSRFNLLFGLPKEKQRQMAILASIIGVFLTLLWLALAPKEISGFYYLIALSGLLAHGVITVLTSGNLLFLFRYFLIWILISGTALAWGFFKGNVLVAPFGPHYQTHEATTAIVAAGMLALCGSSIGWNLALRNLAWREMYNYRPYLSKYSRRLIYAGTLVSYFFAVFYIARAGGVVSEGNLYASESRQGLSIAFNVNNIFIFFGIGLIFLGVTVKAMTAEKVIGLAGGPLILCILTGSRGDYLPQLLVLVVVIITGHRFSQPLESSTQKLSSLPWKNIVSLIVIGVVGFYLSSFIADWRRTGSTSLAWQGLQDGNAGGSFILERQHRMLNLETGNQILGTFYAVVVNLQLGFRDYLFGSSYLDYLLRSPPDILGLPRPQDLAWEMDIQGLGMAQGGIFELAEAYWNFGYTGSFLVPMLISFFFANLLKRALFSGYACPFYACFFIAFGLHAPRSVWYQTFSYFRLITVFMVIYALAWLFAKSFVIIRRN